MAPQKTSASLPSGDSVNEKLDSIIASLSELKSLLSDNQSRITAVETEVGVLKSEMRVLKDVVNRHEQATRNLNVRVLGIPHGSTENTPRLVYDKILKPMLHAAKEAGKIAAVPQLSNTVSEAFRLRSRSGTAPNNHPAQILVKLASPAIKSAIFSFKKSLPLPSESEKADGILRFNITEELTPPSFHLLKALKADDRVHRAWSVDVQLRYSLKNDSQKLVKKVRSVHEHVDTSSESNQSSVPHLQLPNLIFLSSSVYNLSNLPQHQSPVVLILSTRSPPPQHPLPHHHVLLSHHLIFSSSAFWSRILVRPASCQPFD